MDTELTNIVAGLVVGLVFAVLSAWLSRRRWRRSNERWDTWFPEYPDIPGNPVLRRQLAVGAVLNQNNGFPINTLDPQKPREEMRVWLASWWDARNSEQARERIHSLLTGGHAVTFDRLIAVAAEGDPDASRVHLEDAFAEVLDDDPELAEFISHHPEAISRLETLGYLTTPADIARGTRAYDLGRAATVARVAFGAGFLKREEAMALVRMAAFLAERSFASWREFATSYLLGRALWGGVDDPDFDAMVRIADELQRNPRSPWVRDGWFGRG